MTTVPVPLSFSARCRMKEPNALLSASSTFSEKQLAISIGFPALVIALGNRFVSVLNHSGA